MELFDLAVLMGRAERLGHGVRLGALYPATGAGGSLVAVDLLEVEPEGSTPRHAGSGGTYPVHPVRRR